MQIFTYRVWPVILLISLTTIVGAGAAYSCTSAPVPQNDISVPADTVVQRTVIVDQDKLDEISYTKLSANFVDRLMHDLPVKKHLQIFKNVHPDTLDDALDTPRKRLTFWLNIYNGYTQHFLKTDPTLYQNNRGKFFGKEQIPIAGYRVSMEDIEHGVLRRGATIWSKGYIRIRAFRKDFIQKYVVDKLDYRIHFSLNCGAKSCPPVVAYQEEFVARQLNDNSRDYLKKEVEYNEDENVVRAPVLMNWFSADFGGGDGDKRAVLRDHGVLPEGVKPKVKYLNYDWTMMVKNYKAYNY